MHEEKAKPIAPQGMGSQSVARRWAGIHPTVLAYVRSMVKRPEDVEDIVQQVAVAILADDTPRPEDRHFNAWVLGIARNRVLKFWRDEKRHRVVMFNTETVDRVAAFYLDNLPRNSVVTEALEHCMTRLTQRARHLLELRYVRDLKPRDISERLGLSSRGISVTLCRIRESLRTCMNERLQRAESKP